MGSGVGVGMVLIAICGIETGGLIFVIRQNWKKEEELGHARNVIKRTLPVNGGLSHKEQEVVFNEKSKGWFW